MLGAQFRVESSVFLRASVRAFRLWFVVGASNVGFEVEISVLRREVTKSSFFK